MKVYVVSHGEAFQGGRIVAVCASDTAATTAALEWMKRSNETWVEKPLVSNPLVLAVWTSDGDWVDIVAHPVVVNEESTKERGEIMNINPAFEAQQ